VALGEISLNSAMLLCPDQAFLSSPISNLVSDRYMWGGNFEVVWVQVCS
jgi:hypothetical protein